MGDATFKTVDADSVCWLVDVAFHAPLVCRLDRGSDVTCEAGDLACCRMGGSVRFV